MIESETIIVPAIFLIPSAVICMRMWLRHKERMVGLGAGGTRAPADQAAIEARLDRIEQAVEAVAIEMERLGEGQRFITKVLADRPAGAALPSAAPAPNSSGRVTTPH